MAAQIEPIEKAIHRHPFRRRLGKLFYRTKRWLQWHTGTQRMARPQDETLSFLLFEHNTPMLRPLKNVDMYLQYNKITNLRLAAARIDRVLIQPGETFSFWYLVGNPSASKGYLEGLVLENGKATKGIGGGLCQMGNLLYWMALHSPLTVTERWRHSYDAFPDEKRNLPFGSGATLAYNYIDLQIKNETNQDYQICVWLTETNLHGAIRASLSLPFRYEIFEKDHLIRAEIWGGYSRHNRIFRKKIDLITGELLEEMQIAENHALMMYRPFLSFEAG